MFKYIYRLEKKFRKARAWSNRELKKVAPFLLGDVINVSGYKDEDKEGKKYRDYFTNASTYTITNYDTDQGGLQGYDNEFYLDLTKELPKELEGKYDVVFNHTVLEHIYEVHKALENLCKLSRDTIILVVPFLQQMHTNYGDYWRFTPLTMIKMLEDNGLTVIYLSHNNHKKASVYLFVVAIRDKTSWATKFPTIKSKSRNYLFDLSPKMAGCRAIKNSLFIRMFILTTIIVKKVYEKIFKKSS